MAERDRAAVDVDARWVDAELARRLERHGGEGLVDLPEVDVGDGHPRLLQRLGRSGRGRGEHDHRLGAGGRGRSHAGAHLEAVRLGVVAGGERQGGGAVDDAAGVAGGVDVVDLLHVGVALEGDGIERGAHPGEGGLELGERLDGGAGAGVLVLVEEGLALEIDDGEQALGEAVLLDRLLGLVLAVEGEGVAVGAGEALDGGDEVGRDALRHLGELLPQVHVVAVDAAPVGAHRHARHALDAAGDDQLLLAGHHAHGREVERLGARAAEAVQGHARGGVGPAGGEHGVAAHVGALLADLADAADDDVFDVLRAQAGTAGELVQDLGEQLLGVHARKSALAGLAAAARGPDRIEDEDVTHGGYLAFQGGCLAYEALPGLRYAPRRWLKPRRAWSGWIWR